MAALRIATRASPLAQFQARLVASLLASASSASGEPVAAELVLVETAGDQRREVPISELGAQGVFVKEVEQALIDGRADVAVHSAKDLPSSAGSDELAVVAIPTRGDVRDALVGRSLRDLAHGAVVATGAARRRSQLAALRPDLRFSELRGNIATRIAKVPDGGAVVVALAALERLGMSGLAAEVLEVSTMLPQVGQGALAVQCRADDESAAALCRLIDDPDAHRCVAAERAFLAELGGGCDLPVGAFATAGSKRADLLIEGMVATLDGTVVLRARSSGGDGERVARALARELLDLRGGSELLARASRES